MACIVEMAKNIENNKLISDLIKSMILISIKNQTHLQQTTYSLIIHSKESLRVNCNQYVETAIMFITCSILFCSFNECPDLWE